MNALHVGFLFLIVARLSSSFKIDIDAAKVDCSIHHVTTGNAVSTLRYRDSVLRKRLSFSILIYLNSSKFPFAEIYVNTPLGREEGSISRVAFLTDQKEKGRTSHFLCFRKLESERQNRDVARVNALRKRDRHLLAVIITVISYVT